MERRIHTFFAKSHGPIARSSSNQSSDIKP
jgi:hypothetical protein